MEVTEEARTKLFRSRLRFYQDISSIAESLVSEGDDVVEMFGWVNHNIAMIVKSIIGKGGEYYTISDYTKYDDVGLFTNFLRAYDSFWKLIIGCSDDIDESIAEIITYVEQMYSADYILPAIQEYRPQVKVRELVAPPRSKRMKDMAKSFFERIGLVQLHHMMPPMLPEGVEVNPKMVIEWDGFPYCHPAGLCADVVRSAFDYLAPGGYLVIGEPRKEFRSSVEALAESELNGRYAEKTVNGLNSPEHYMILQKTG